MNAAGEDSSMKSTRLLSIALASLVLLASISTFRVNNRDPEGVPFQQLFPAIGAITITGNADPYLLSLPGTGTAANPYRLENQTINANNIGSCILLSQVTAHLVIRNCTIINSGVQSTRAGINLDMCSNITITNCTIQYNSNGMMLTSSQDISISGNYIGNNTQKGLYFEDSSGNFVTGNRIHGNGQHGIYLINGAQNTSITANSFKDNAGGNYYWDGTGAGNAWYVGIFGNVWDDYTSRYPSATNDLFTWDTPYVIGNNPYQADMYPLVSQKNIHTPISIDGNAEMDAFPDKTGLGTPASPYVIRDMRIGAGSSPTCIFIKNVDRHLILLNITMSGAKVMQGTGIQVENSKNLNITGCRTTMNKYGVYMTGTSEVTLSTNRATSNVQQGMYIENCNNFTILGSMFDDNVDSGLYIRDSERINISTCTFLRNNASGLHTYNVRNLTIIQNEMSYNNLNGIIFDSAMNCTAANNNISANDEGILISSSLQLVIANNSFTNCTIRFVMDRSWFYGHDIPASNKVNGRPLIYVYNQNNMSPGLFSGAGGAIVVNCTNSTISNMEITRQSVGLQITDSANLTVSNLSVSGCTAAGIHTTFSTNITVKDSIFSSNKESINFNEQTIRSTIKNNTIWTSEYGILMRDTISTSVQDNHLFGCGIWVEGSDHAYHWLQSISTSNRVNNKVVYYYVNQTGLRPQHFTNAGQIILINCNNSILQDCNVSNTSVGVFIYLGGNNSLSKVDASFNTVAGLDNRYAASTRIDECKFTDNGKHGVIFLWSDKSTMARSIISRNKLEGIILGVTENSMIDNNTISSNQDGVRFIISSHNVMMRNVITYNTRYGIQFESGNNNSASRNYIAGNGDTGIKIEAGAQTTRVFWNVISQNHVHEAYSLNSNSLWEFGGRGNFWGDLKSRYPGATKTGIFWSIPYEIQSTPGVHDGHPMIIGDDFDNDGLSNEVEVVWYNTNPTSIDSDSDGMDDHWEITHGLNPLFANDQLFDNDNDGLLNYQEYRWRTDPNDPDTDKDGFLDGIEVQFGSNPSDSMDTPVTRWILIPGLVAGAIIVVVLGSKLAIKQKHKKNAITTTTESTREVETDLLAVSRAQSENQLQQLTQKQAMLSRILAPQTRSEMVGVAADAVNMTPIDAGIKMKKAGGKTAETEHVERKIDEKTESEVQVQVKEESCIVCENKLKGTNYVCPSCKTKYCIRCAIALSERKEACWVCKKELVFD